MMKTNRFLAFLVVLPCGVLAQTSPTAAPSATPPAAQISTLRPAPPAPDAAELTKLLNEFLAGASKNDVATHERFWADDLIYTGSVGRRIGKADILREVRAEGVPKTGDETTTYTAEDIRIQQYGTTAIVAFRLIGTTTKGDKTEAASYLNTGTFLKRDGKWQVVNWQATKMPSDKGPTK